MAMNSRGHHHIQDQHKDHHDVWAVAVERAEQVRTAKGHKHSQEHREDTLVEQAVARESVMHAKVVVETARKSNRPQHTQDVGRIR